MKRRWLALLLFTPFGALASSDWYTATGAPAANSQASSATMRGEFALIQAATDKLPTMAGHGSQLVMINSGGTALTSSSSITVAQGGTGATSLTAHAPLVGNGTSAITALTPLTTGQILVGSTGVDPVAQSGATLRTTLGLGTADSPTFTGLTLTTPPTLSSPLTVANGGTGAATLTSHGVLVGAGTSAVSGLTALSTGDFLVGSTGANPVAQSGNTARHSLSLGTADSPTFTSETLSSNLTLADTITTTGAGLTLSNGGETLATFAKDGADVLYYNNVDKVDTDPQGMIVHSGTSIATPATANPGYGDITFYDADGTDSIAQLGFYNTTELYFINQLRNGFLELGITGGAGAYVPGLTLRGDDGTVNINYNGSARVATSNAGATVTGTLNATTAVTVNGAAVLTTAEPLVQAGAQAGMVNGASAAVTFGTTFGAAPSVTCTPVIASSTNGNCSVSSISSSGFTLWNYVGSTITVNWTAVGTR